ncbi:MAG: MBL fold metallo-hydrolase, partial [Bacteroidales bacterium]|nr:MBL fold metallo-hydrolase [Bacteroidales bacterium]
MKVTVIVDNIPSGDLKGEWGLCFFIEYNGNKYLLDTGASDLFLSNAVGLGIDIKDVDCAILSHAHYDHTLGMDAFFRVNSKAKFHISANTSDNCYAKALFVKRYIGIEKGILEKYPKRLAYVSGVTEIDPGVWIVPHSTEGLAKVGRRNHMYVLVGSKLVPDDFSHEQSLVFRTESGLVVFN